MVEMLVNRRQCSTFVCRVCARSSNHNIQHIFTQDPVDAHLLNLGLLLPKCQNDMHDFTTRSSVVYMSVELDFQKTVSHSSNLRSNGRIKIRVHKISFAQNFRYSVPISDRVKSNKLRVFQNGHAADTSSSHEHEDSKMCARALSK